MPTSMASAAASPPKVVTVDTDEADPFVSPAPSNNSDSRRRYAGFDKDLFSIYAEGSPSQAKRALEAHLAETERRLQEASQLGTVLVQQRRELSDRLKEVERQSDATEIGPELRAKLVELEREFNEVGKDTARAFIPKTRVPSYHQSLDAEGNSIFSSEAQNSPSKISVPSSRKQRNQQPNRIHDIKLATEISSSLLNQVRELQAALAEKDEQLKLIGFERSRLEVEVEGLTQRLRVLDESEQRFKDENWSLETRIQELMAQQKESADKEHRLNQNLTTANTEKTAVERELEDLKQAHGKLHEEYQATHRQYEAEVMGLRRNVSSGDTERSALQRKIDDLLSQNEELARAVAYHRRLEESGSGRNSNEDGEGHDSDQSTPEHSPPPSPSKFTPRHSQLETETLKSSLQHAHRMIQNLKNNIHREKTEKMELRRLLQETKDELDIAKRELASGAPASVKKRRPNERQDLFKKPPRPDRLGMARGSRDEIIVDDGDWEDNDEHDVPETPSRRPKPAIGGVGLSPFSRRVTSASFNASNEAVQTATESSDAFETANERDTATETEAFQTGLESMAGSSTEEDTETEMGSSRGQLRSRRYSRLSQVPDNQRDSYLSTASTSGDDMDSEMDVSTPQRTEQPRYRLKVTRGARRSLFNGNTSDVTKSPSASFMSDGSVAEADGGKSLLAELGNFSERDSDMDPESEPGTPGRSSIISPQESPDMRRAIADRALIRKASLARVPMVDSSMNTDPWSPQAKGGISSTAAALGAAIAGGIGFGRGKDQEAQARDREATPELAPSAIEESSFDSPASTTASTGTVLPKTIAEEEVAVPAPVPLALSEVNSQQVEPLEPQVEPVAPQNLQVSSVASLHSEEPIEPVAPEAPKLAFSSVASLHSEPVEPAAPEAPKLAYSSVASLHSEEPIEPAAPEVPKLALSSLASLHSEPVEPEAPAAPTLALSSVSSLHSEPVEPEAPITPKLGISSVSSLDSEPVEPEAPTLPKVVPPPLHLTPISSLHSEPLESELPATVVRAKQDPSQLSSIVSLHSEPVEAEAPATRELKSKASNSQLSAILAVDSEPVSPEVPKVTPPSFNFSTIASLDAEPIQPVEPEVKVQPVDLQLSSISSLQSEPVAVEAPAAPKPTPSVLSPVLGQAIEPVAVEAPAVPKPTPSVFSPVLGQAIEPVALPIPEIFTTPAPAPVEHVEDKAVPALSYTNISSQYVEPEEATMPGRPLAAERNAPVFDEVYDNVMAKDLTTREVASQEPIPESAERAVKKPKVSMADEGTQTMFSAAEIDGLIQASKEREAYVAIGAPPSPTKTPSSPSKSSFNSPKKDAAAYKTVRRPGSAQSMRSARSENAPPLPADHKEVIAAAAQKTPVPQTSSSMGPPAKPASAYKGQNSSHSSQFRPRTPNGTSTPSGSIHRSTSPHSSIKGGTTPRARLTATRSEVSSPISRRTSVSSFTSEVEQRFNIPINPVGREEYGQSIDPRMVQAITQTMIGEYLWKYTRKAGREEMSVNRHRRFFWVHPYTRTLYWSDQDPATAGKAQLKAKSVQIEDVRVETDDNPFPPGLHRKSLIVVTPGRSVKFTATTGQRHETWFNALSYLLLRTSNERDDEHDPNGQSLSQEEAREFNPTYARTQSRQTARSRMSLSSYNSRTTRNSSPQHNRLASISKRRAAEQRTAALTPTTSASMSGRFSSLSGMFRPPPAFRGSFSSKQGKANGQEASIYDASIVPDSAEDLRQVIEAQEREADRLENVRACCDGKHDVGSLSKKPHGHHHHHNRKVSHTRTNSFGASTFLSSQNDLDARSRNSSS